MPSARGVSGGKQSWAVAKIAGVVESFGDPAQQARAWKDAAESGRLRAVAAAAGHHTEEEVAVALFEQEQRKKMLVRATEPSRCGRASDDKRSSVEANLVAVAPSPEKEDAPSLRADQKTLNAWRARTKREMMARAEALPSGWTRVRQSGGAGAPCVYIVQTVYLY